MEDPQKDIWGANPETLCKFMDQLWTGERVWCHDELAEMLRHELGTPVEFELGRVRPTLAAQLHSLCAAQGLLLRSLGELLNHPHPPVELLILTKEYAKACRNHPEGPLPAEVCDVVYYASIVAAMLRCSRRITELDEASLGAGLRSLLAEDWLDPTMRGLFERGLAHLSPNAGKTP